MTKKSDADNTERSSLFLGSEPLQNVRYRSAAQDDDKTDKPGDSGDDSKDTDGTDSDGTDADGTDSDATDKRDADGKD